MYLRTVEVPGSWDGRIMRRRSTTLNAVSAIATVENKLARDASAVRLECVADVFVIFSHVFQPHTDHGTQKRSQSQQVQVRFMPLACMYSVASILVSCSALASILLRKHKNGYKMYDPDRLRVLVSLARSIEAWHTGRSDCVTM